MFPSIANLNWSSARVSPDYSNNHRGSITGVEIGEQFKNFFAYRAKAKQRLYDGAVFWGLLIFTCGSMCVVSRSMVPDPQHSPAWYFLTIAGPFIRDFGICMLFIVPADEFDLFKLLFRSYYIRCWACFFSSICFYVTSYLIGTTGASAAISATILLGNFYPSVSYPPAPPR